MRIILFEESEKNQWNEFIAENCSESFLQSWEWGNFQESLGRRIWRMGVVEDRGFHSGISPVEPKMQDLHMRFHSPKGTMEPSKQIPITNYKLRITNYNISALSRRSPEAETAAGRYPKLPITNYQLLAIALIVKQDLPFWKSYLYCPRGPVLKVSSIKYQVSSVLDLLFCEIKKIAKKEGAMFLRFDPPVSRWFHSGNSPLERGEGCVNVEPECESCAKGSTALSGLWSQHNCNFKKSPNEIQPRDTLILDLTKSEEELLKEMKQKTRYNIKLAERKKLEIRNWKLEIGKLGNSLNKKSPPYDKDGQGWLRCENRESFKKDFEEFWKLVEETSARDKFASHNKNYYWKMLEGLSEIQNFAGSRGFHNGISPVEPKMQDLHMRFHSPKGTMEPSKKIVKSGGNRQKILKQVQNDSCSCSQKLQARLYLAEYENKIIAANIVLYFGDLAVYLHGASSSEYRNVMAPHLLQWRQILDAKNAGCEKYDFWGVSASCRFENEGEQALVRLRSQNTWQGITRFKKGFGGEEKNYIGAYDAVFDNIGYAAYRFVKSIKYLVSSIKY